MRFWFSFSFKLLNFAKSPHMRIRKIADELLTMSKAEQNGALVLIIILVLLIIFRFFVPHLFNDKASYQEDIREMIATVEKQGPEDIGQLPDKNVLPEAVKTGKSEGSTYSLSTTSKSNEPIHMKTEVAYFTFDPNTVTKPELLQLGLTEKAANVFINYRNGGAVFYQKTDLLKIYSIDSVMYQKLAPYVSILNQVNKPEIKEKPVALPQIKIEINSADSALWTTLPGIGPVFASRICKYRNALGGFVKVEQLLEVYNFSEERYEQIYSLLTLDTTRITKINLNFASVYDLKRHPYCNDETARKIVDYRSKAGSFHSVGTLIRDSVLTSSEFDKLSPYLQVLR